MQLDRKAGLMLGVTFVLGVVVGAFGAGALRPPPPPRPDDGRPPGTTAQDGGEGRPNDQGQPRAPRDSRFVSEMERFIAPRDSAQRALLRPHLLAADSANTRYVKTARDSMTLVMRRMRDAMAPLLDEAQRQRLDSWVERPWDDQRADRRAPAPRRQDDQAKPPGDPLQKPGNKPPPRGAPRP